MRFEYDESGQDWENEACEYNGTQVMKATLTNSDGETDINTYEWSNGNLVKVNESNAITTLEYYTDKSNQAGDYLNVAQLTQGYEIFRNKNLVKSVKNNSDIIKVIYTYDSEGKVTSLTSNDGTDTYYYKYEYQCK